MSIFFAGSSELARQPIPIMAPPDAVDSRAASVRDEALPNGYAVDRIRLLVQSPYKLYLYWSLARDPFETLRRAFGDQAAAQYTLVARLRNIEDNNGAQRHPVNPDARAQWFAARPASAYIAEVGLYAARRSFVRLLTSNIARTPRAAPAREADGAAQFRVSAPEFARVLNEAGYPNDALEVMLEAADEASEGHTTPNIVEQLTDAHAPVEVETAELRALVAALAFGLSVEQLLDESLAALSVSLRRWLESVRAEQQQRPTAFDSSRVLNILQSALALGFDERWRDTQANVNFAAHDARFLWSASRVHLPAPPPRLWMPSMTAGANSVRQT